MRERWSFADCRMCRHFISINSSRIGEVLRARLVMEARLRGGQLLGYCTAYDRCVTYYVGTCPRFTPKRDYRNCISLTKWLK